MATMSTTQRYGFYMVIAAILMLALAVFVFG